MLLSHRKKFIFVHIYKTAGTSVMDLFLPHARLIDRVVYKYFVTRKLIELTAWIMGWADDGYVQFTGIHKHAKAIEIKEILGDAFDGYYKFAFVRNPYDLLVSLYFYITQSRAHGANNQIAAMNFKDFLWWHVAQAPPRQVDFIMENQKERFLVDYVGRYETMHADIENIATILGLSVKRRLRHKNPSLLRKSKDYRDYYDAEDIALVRQYFADDFDLLGYDFEGFAKEFALPGSN